MTFVSSHSTLVYLTKRDEPNSTTFLLDIFLIRNFPLRGTETSSVGLWRQHKHHKHHPVKRSERGQRKQRFHQIKTTIKETKKEDHFMDLDSDQQFPVGQHGQMS